MLTSIGTILGLIAGGLGALYFAYLKIMDIFFTDRVNSDTSKEIQLSQQISTIEQQITDDKKTADTAKEEYDKANSNNTPDNSGK